MSDGNDSKSGKTRKNVPDRILNFGRHLLTPNFGRKSKSRSPTASSTSGKKTLPVTATASLVQAPSGRSAPPAAGLSAPGRTFAGSTDSSSTGPATSSSSVATRQPATTLLTLAQTPAATTLPQTLSPLEIRQRTADLLKVRLTPEEVERIKWDETTPEQARAVVEGVQKSLEGKPEHTGKMYKTLQYVNKYSTIIDVAIQHQPCITALVWAGMRTVIQVGD